MPDSIPSQWFTITVLVGAMLVCVVALIAVMWHTVKTQQFTLGLMDRYHAKNYNEFVMSQMVAGAGGGKNGMHMPGFETVKQPGDPAAALDREAIRKAVERAEREAEELGTE